MSGTFCGKLLNAANGFDGSVTLTFVADPESKFAARQLAAELMRDKDKTVQVEVGERKRKRSLNANSYLWTLLDKAAEKFKTSRDELYRQYIRDYGVYADMSVESVKFDGVAQSWETGRLGWICSKICEDGNRTEARFYIGSSAYTSSQMARLIDAVVEDCRAAGIETMTPAELERMIEKWTPKTGNS